MLKLLSQQEAKADILSKYNRAQPGSSQEVSPVCIEITDVPQWVKEHWGENEKTRREK